MKYLNFSNNTEFKMKLFYDFHIHSALSPCAENEMTPNNIVNMALLKDLDIISITDHNSIKNLEAFDFLTKSLDLLFVPGIEIQTSEDIHVICLFKTIHSIQSFYDELSSYQMNFPHNSVKFGEQLILNENDEITGEESISLLFSLNIKFYELFKLVEKHLGVFIPAHIGRKSYSIISQLGFLPKDLPITTVEINGDLDKSLYKNYHVLTNSDAHQLGQISERVHSLDLEEKSIDSLFIYLRSI